MYSRLSAPPPPPHLLLSSLREQVFLVVVPSEKNMYHFYSIFLYLVYFGSLVEKDPPSPV